MRTTETTLQKLIDSRGFHLAILGIIILNAIVIGLQTSKDMMADFGQELQIAEYTILGIFVLELLLKLFVWRKKFFTRGWNVFDFIVITISLLPHAAGLSIFRSFRIIQSLEMFQISPHMNNIIRALRHVGPSVVNVCFLMIVSFYILGVIGVELFSEDFPDLFGSLPWSLFTLFRLMVYDDYGNLTRPILEIYPYAWIYLLIISIILAFIMINLFVAVVVTALQKSIDTEKDPVEVKVGKELKMHITDEKSIQMLHAEIQELKEMMKALAKKVM